jgi:serine/threonine-protein kinase
MAVLSSQAATASCVASTERPTVRALPVERPRRRAKPATLAAGDRIGPWRIDSELGRGGMGSVYAVTHCGFGKRAALKLCHKSVLGEQFTIDMFLREARIVHLINHPGVPDVFATGTYDARPYLAMERLHGKTLGDYLDAQAITRTQALDLLFEIARVISAAHGAGVIHRDLKLDNVFVLDTPPEVPLQLKVLDWGVARIAGEPDPMAGMIAGTLTYVAPEQIRADDLTPAGDVYSLGVLAYQLLFGAPPFTHKCDLELIRMHVQAPPPRPSDLWPEIPAGLEAMLLAMLAKTPEQRPSIDDILRGIVVARRELRPRRPTLLGRLRALPRRPPVDVLGRSAPLLDTFRLTRALVATRRRLAMLLLAVGATASTLAALIG